MNGAVAVVGAGLAGSEAALTLADCGCAVHLFEMRPVNPTLVHRGGDCAELVCSNSLKSTRPESAAGMLKAELAALDSRLFAIALDHAVDAGGALAVDRNAFAAAVTRAIEDHPLIRLRREEVRSLKPLADAFDAILLACGPMASPALAEELETLVGEEALAFYDAAAPIVLAESLDERRLFAQNRYDSGAGADYLNAFMDRATYDAFVEALIDAERVIKRDFESRELFSACQPIEEIARSGHDALRHGALKPVGLIDPRDGRRPWAAVQLRKEDRFGQSFNLVGFQTNLTFPEQRRVFSMIPGLESAEFARFGVMHRNTFVNAPKLLDASLRWRDHRRALPVPLFIVGQLSGTEGYAEAIRSGLHGALSVAALQRGLEAPSLDPVTAFGALLRYATDPTTVDYQPLHVNFGVMPPLTPPVRSKRRRYEAYALRAKDALATYGAKLVECGLMTEDQRSAGWLRAQPYLPSTGVADD